MKLSYFAALLIGIFIVSTGHACAEDVVTLDDGTVLKGKFQKEEGESVLLQQADGEIAVIPKSRVKRMEVATGPMFADPLTKKPEKLSDKDKDAKPAIGNRNNAPRNLDPGWAKPRMAEMEDFGSPELAKRKAVLEKVKQSKDEYTMVMLAMLNPKMKTAEYVRIGILRAFVDLAPISDEAAKTIAYAAMFDPFPEAKREACRTIRYLQDDRGIRELVKYVPLEGNTALKQAAAAALHEIDDNRIYGSLVHAILAPTIQANYGEASGLDKPKYVLNGGPGGLQMPVFTPSQSVSGVASDYGGPAADFLKMLARKDMGNFPYAWSLWYNEKIGQIGKEERDAYHDKRSLKDRINGPN